MPRRSLLPKMSFLFNFLFHGKVLWNLHFLAKGCIVEQHSRKETPLKIRFYYQNPINLPIKTFSKAWKWHPFDLVLKIKSAGAICWLVLDNFNSSGVFFLEFCSMMQPFAQNGFFWFNILFNGKVSWKLQFSGKRLRHGAKFKKRDPT